MLKNPLNLLSLAAGAILPLAFAPLAWWTLAIVSACIYLFVIDKQYANLETQEAGFFYGLKPLFISSLMYWLGFYVIGVSWVFVSIHEYGHTPAFLAAILSFLFCLGLALVSSLQIIGYHLLRLHQFAPITFPASILLMEWFRGWFLSGFPWLFHGYALLDSPMEVFASVGGIYLLSFVVLLLASALYQIFKILIAPEKPFSFAVLGFAFMMPAVIIASTIYVKQKNWVQINTDEKIRVHLIQGNIPQEDKWLPENQQKILDTYIKLIKQSFSIIDQEREIKPDTKYLLVLPEAAMPTFQSELNYFFAHLDKEANKRNTAIISGIFFDEFHRENNEYDVYNSIIAVGNASGLYHKQKLVPFGEYVPFEKLIRGLIPFFDLPFSSFSRGWEHQEDLQVFDYHIAPFICYEVLYPSLVFEQGKKADLLLTISNDAWFGDSWGPEQHFEMARMRALELGKYLIRTTNTGTTAVIGPDGKVISLLEKDKRQILEEDVFSTTGQTPFSRWGNLPILLLNLLFVSICSVYTLKKAVRKTAV